MAEYQSNTDEPIPVTNVFVDCNIMSRASSFLRVGDADRRDRSGYVEVMRLEGELARLRILAIRQHAQAAREEFEEDDGPLRMAETYVAIQGHGRDISITRVNLGSPNATLSSLPPYIERRLEKLRESEQQAE